MPLSFFPKVKYLNRFTIVSIHSYRPSRDTALQAIFLESFRNCPICSSVFICESSMVIVMVTEYHAPSRLLQRFHFMLICIRNSELFMLILHWTSLGVGASVWNVLL